MPKENNSVMSPTLIQSLLILKHGSKIIQICETFLILFIKKEANKTRYSSYLFRFKAILYFNILLLALFCFELSSSSSSSFFFCYVFFLLLFFFFSIFGHANNESFLAEENREKVPD